ncbi:MAG: haloacid dehalogenase type II [Bacteroidota bacterium]
MEKPQALIFDVNETLLDLGALRESVGKALGDKPDLLPLWFRMLLHYSLVATVGDRYHNFGEIGVAALQMVALNQGIELSPSEAQKALVPIRSLPPHPDVIPALEALKAKGYRMYTLTNSSYAGLRTQMAHAGLTDYFEELYSVEGLQMFKPHTHVYRWMAHNIKLDTDQCMMVAAHGWDVAGAQWAGLRTAFIRRQGQQMYPLAEKPTVVVDDLKVLAQKLP